jgi:hypothetical protein
VLHGGPSRSSGLVADLHLRHSWTRTPPATAPGGTAEAVALTVDEMGHPEPGKATLGDGSCWAASRRPLEPIGREPASAGRVRRTAGADSAAPGRYSPKPPHQGQVDPDGHLFVGEGDSPLSESVYGRVWQDAPDGSAERT